MGIYLPNMEMPKNCEACELAKHFDGYQENDCPFNAFSYYDCPLIPVPPHGRLIDADAFDGVICNQVDLQNQAVDFHYDNCDCGFIDGLIFTRSRIRNAPTVIPASEEVET